MTQAPYEVPDILTRVQWPLTDPIPEMTDGDLLVRPYLPDSDAAALFEALDDPRVWTYIPGGAPATATALASRLTRRLSGGLRASWVIQTAGTVVGTSSFIFDPADDAGIEIGATYLAPRLWGTGINQQTKAMMIEIAYRSGAAWIQFRTDERNLRSAAAILKLGAVEQAARQEQRLRSDGTQRISRFFRLFPPR
jgi:RimJ/RimL family protein N-acetyltransferase